MNQSMNPRNAGWMIALGTLVVLAIAMLCATGGKLPGTFQMLTSTPRLASVLFTQAAASAPPPTATLAATATQGSDRAAPGWSSSLSVHVPLGSEISQDMLSIWNANNLSVDDMTAPGVMSFSGTAQRDTEYMWPVYWCAKDQETFGKNLQNMTTVFRVDGEAVPEQYLYEYYYDANSGWKCDFRGTVLGGWQAGTYTLRVERTFKTALNDGEQFYPAGIYVYELTITVK